jgi:hypothetical protein
MHILAGVVGLILRGAVLLDAFETIVLPRRVSRRFRLTRLFYRYTWQIWRVGVRRALPNGWREDYLGFYGPFSLLLLLGLWATGLIVGFALVQWALGSALSAPDAHPDFGTDLYMSGTTFFTVGFGDVVPRGGKGRLVAVIEGGMGFAFLGAVIGYLPVLYQAFSRREVSITLLDARAGSPPTALELLLRHCPGNDLEAIRGFLQDWERWAAELLESHLSYPVLGYFRSQHENESWLAALTMILDSCALVMAGSDGPAARTARLTFAMARHAAVDLAQVFDTPPRPPAQDRLPPADLAHLREALAAADVLLKTSPAVDEKLDHLRRMYEPYVNALAEYLQVTLPPWLPAADAHDNWRTAVWDRYDGISLV